MSLSGHLTDLPRFRDRAQAGKTLAARLEQYAGRSDALVLALPRGGVPVGFEVARALQLPLDLLLVRKVGVPGHEELAMGAVASGGVVVVNRAVADSLGIGEEAFQRAVEGELKVLESRARLYRGRSPEPEVQGRVVILVDDGLATGSTMRAAVRAVRQRNPQRVVVAVPVGAASTCDEMRHEADEVVCVLAPEAFYAVGAWYENFDQTSDEQVRRLLEESHTLQSRQESRAVL